MDCFHTDSTRTDMVGATIRWTCEQLGATLSQAIDYVFDTKGSCPPCVLVSESLIDEFAPPLEWSLKREKWWDRIPTIPRPHLEGHNRQDSNDDYRDPLLIEDAETPEGERVQGKSADEVLPPEISVTDQRAALVCLACCLQSLSQATSDRLNVVTGTQVFQVAGQAMLLCVPRFKWSAGRSRWPLEIVASEILLHELVHARQPIAHTEDQIWEAEVQAQFFAFEAAQHLDARIAHSFVERAASLPLPYRLFLRTAAARKILSETPADMLGGRP